jgi:hypothetical protein
MASLLLAAKWIRSAVCTEGVSERPPLPDAAHLAPLGLNPVALNAIASHVARRLDAVSSLLENGERPTIDRHRFPAQRWPG